MTALAGVLKVNTTLKELNIAGNHLDAEDIKILAPAIQDNGALASLDVSRNDIGDAQEAKIKQICASKSIKCTL